jgi:type IV fimbrial biogenesis protein FimT
MPQRGFTLLESLIVLVIVGVLVAIGYPAVNDLRLRRDNAAKVNLLNSSIRVAKTEAVRRGRTVTLCPASNPLADLPECGGVGSNWAAGWVIFVDDGPTPGTLEPGETIVSVQQAFGGDGTITNNTIGSMNFQATGLPMPPVQSSFTFKAKPDAESVGKYSKYLILSAQGRVRLSDSPASP